MKRNLTWRAFLALIVGLGLMLAACGSDDDDAAADETTTDDSAADDTETDDAEADDEAAVDETTTTEAAEETTTTAAADDTETDDTETDDTAADDAGSGIGVTLNDDFELLLTSDPAAGSVTFNVSNDGPDFPHALTIVKAASIDDLPRNEANGAIDVDAMDPADIIGSTAIPMAGGTAEDLTVDLEAGDYVFFCPVQNDTQSHVAAGQIISVSVAG